MTAPVVLQPTPMGGRVAINPLLPEFDYKTKIIQKFLRATHVLTPEGDLNGGGIAGLFFVLALITSGLSVVSGTGLIHIEIVMENQPVIGGSGQCLQPACRRLELGYIYELNAAIFYLVGAPLFVLFGARFLWRARIALEDLNKNGKLVDRLKRPNVSALALINNKPLKIVWSVLSILLIITVALIVYNQEFNSETGNYEKLAFGYVQAPFIAKYDGLTLEKIVDNGRKIRNLSGIKLEEFKRWSVKSVSFIGKRDNSDKYYWIFIVFALGIQVLFIPFSIWLVLKGVYLFYFVSRAISPDGKFRVFLKLDDSNDDHRFGISLLDRAYNNIAVVVGISAIGTALAAISNLAKGSRGLCKVRCEDGVNAFAIYGQNLLAYLPIVMSVGMAVFILIFHFRVERLYPIAVNQSTWPDLPALWAFGGVTILVIAPALAMGASPGMAISIYSSWVGTVDLMIAMVRLLL